MLQVSLAEGQKQSPVVVKRKFTEEEQKLSSAWRELSAVCRFVRHFEEKELLKNHTILLLTDNKSVVSCMKQGSPVKNLQELSLKIFYSISIVKEVE